MLIISPGECERRNGELRGAGRRIRCADDFRPRNSRPQKTLARWIEDPAVLHDRAAASRRRDGREPIERLLTCQIKVMWFYWHVYEMAGRGPSARHNDCYGSA